MGAAAATLTYRYPASVAGGAVAPTQAQMASPNKLSKVVCDAACPDNLAATDIIHNMQLPTATGLDASPEISLVCIVGGAAQGTPVVVVKDANTVTLTQSPNAGAGNGGTWRITIARPNTIDG